MNVEILRKVIVNGKIALPDLIDNDIDIDDKEFVEFIKNENITLVSQVEDLFNEDKLLDFHEEIELSNRILKGDMEARNILVVKNMPLADYIASKFNVNGLDREDLKQIAYHGLILAANKYNGNKGYRFSTYAYYYIYRELNFSLYSNYSKVKISRYSAMKMIQYFKIKNKMELELDRSLSIEEMEEYCSFTREEIEEFEHLKKYHPNSVASLDYIIPGNDADNTALGDTIVDENTNIEKEVTNKVFMDGLVEVVHSILNERDAYIIINRYGLNENKITKTLKELHEDPYLKGLSRERIRQLEEKALLKLKRYLKRNGIYESI